MLKGASITLRMANKAKARCAKCNKIRKYTNPMMKCWECKQTFCYDHIWTGLLKEGMKKTEEFRHICERCKDKFNYKETL